MAKELGNSTISTLKITAYAACFVVLCMHVRADDATQFRGPSGNGVLPASVPTNWDSETNVSWSVEIPGGGWSSPVIAGNLVFLTTAVAEGEEGPKGWGEGVQSMGSFYRSAAPSKPYSFQVHCLNLADGTVAWKKQIVSRKPPYKIHPSNSYATESPVTDGERVFAYFAAVGVIACLNTEGEQLWSRELGAFKTGNDFGTGSSLALHDGLVFVQCDNEEKSFVCALDASSGEDVWKDDRNSRTSWSSPVIWTNRIRSELVTCGSGTVTSYEPSSGKVIWQLTGAGGAFSSTPTFDQDRIYFGQSGRNSRGPLVAVNAGATGDLTFNSLRSSDAGWAVDSSAPGMCSAVALDGRVYVLSRGILSCHDAQSGQRIYRERLKDASSVTASLWAAGNNIFALNESGKTSVIRSGSEFQLAGTNEIGGLYWSTPTATPSSLLIRSADKLYCIEN